MRGRQILWRVILLSVMIAGCGLEEISRDPNSRHVLITVKPKGARVVVKSMSDSKILTLTPPYEFDYILRPYQATYIEISHQGYRRQIKKLDGTREELIIKLEKMTEEEVIMLKYKTEAAGRAGPGLDDIPGVSGGVGGPGIGPSGGMGGDMGGNAGGAFGAGGSGFAP